MDNKNKIEKGIDIEPEAISLTGSPKTGKKLLFYKSHNGGNSMKTLSLDAQAAAKEAYEKIAPFKAQFSEDFVAQLEKSATGEDLTKHTETIIKSFELPQEVKDTLNTLVESQKALMKSNEDLAKKLEKTEEERTEDKKAELKKSCETAASELGSLPVEKSILGELMFELQDKFGKEIHDKVVDVFTKANKSIKEALPKEPKGTEKEGAPEGDGTADAFVKAVLAEVEKDTVSKDRTTKIIKAQTLVRKRDEKSYEAYNKAVLDKSIQRIQ